MFACRAQGPSAAEERMFHVWDVFEKLLTHKPVLAVELSYQLATLAEQYNESLSPHARAAATANEGDRCR